MQQILLNMANHLLIEFCKAKGINCSGTVCVKNGRGFTYGLKADPHSRPDIDPRWPVIARVTFHKNQEPTYGWN